MEITLIEEAIRPVIASAPTKADYLSEEQTDLPPFGTPEEEAEDERLWQEKFALSLDTLAKMAASARTERQQGKTLPLDKIIDG